MRAPIVLPVDTREVYAGWDPGKTNGYLSLACVPSEKKLYVLDRFPVRLNERYPDVDIEAPPIIVFQDFYESVVGKYEAFMDLAKEHDVLIHTAIEDFTGGMGGNTQNTVNKLIGIIMAAVFEKNHFESRITLPKVYRNVSRLPYLKQAKTLAARPEYAHISHHSVDAGAHALHRVHAEHQTDFRQYTLI